jgi:hydroxymethylpyrimidine/phosphomethylpyrimidine kinase
LGGAGIQADLKTFAAYGVYGMSVVTAVTAQNTRGVRAIHTVPPEIVGQQIDAVIEDIPPAAVKTGMLPSAQIVRLVAERLRFWQTPNVVIDPVMVASSGDPLQTGDALGALREALLPLARVLTPNLPEAERLLGRPVRDDEEDVVRAAEELCRLGPQCVVLKGGHRGGEEAVDVLFEAATGFVSRFAGPRLETRHTHGTGCTFASAIAARLAQGASLPAAMQDAKDYVNGAIAHAPGLGGGHGPLWHGWRSFPSPLAPLPRRREENERASP